MTVYPDNPPAGIRELVAQIESDVAAARERATRRPTPVIEQIRHDLGTVTVTGHRLDSVDLDAREITWSTSATLAAAVLDAIRRAEAHHPLPGGLR